MGEYQPTVLPEDTIGVNQTNIPPRTTVSPVPKEKPLQPKQKLQSVNVNTYLDKPFQEHFQNIMETDAYKMGEGVMPTRDLFDLGFGRRSSNPDHAAYMKYGADHGINQAVWLCKLKSCESPSWNRPDCNRCR